MAVGTRTMHKHTHFKLVSNTKGCTRHAKTTLYAALPVCKHIATTTEHCGWADKVYFNQLDESGKAKSYARQLNPFTSPPVVVPRPGREKHVIGLCCVQGRLDFRGALAADPVSALFRPLERRNNSDPIPLLVLSSLFFCFFFLFSDPFYFLFFSSFFSYLQSSSSRTK